MKLTRAIVWVWGGEGWNGFKSEREADQRSISCNPFCSAQILCCRLERFPFYFLLVLNKIELWREKYDHEQTILPLTNAHHPRHANAPNPPPLESDDSIFPSLQQSSCKNVRNDRESHGDDGDSSTKNVNSFRSIGCAGGVTAHLFKYRSLMYVERWKERERLKVARDR